MRPAFFPLIALALVFNFSCRGEPAPAARKSPGLTAVATIFPVYDFARKIGGGRVAVSMLIPPGVETHEFEPHPDDYVRVHGADFFLYTGPVMEPWAGQLAAGIGNNKTEVVDVGAGIAQRGSSPDPHIWLDFANAEKMADVIAESFSRKDPSDRDFYLKNAGGLKDALAALDARYASGLKNCRTHIFVHGSHKSFGRLALRYGLRYEAAVDSFRDAEPLPGRMVELTRLMRDNGIKFVLYDELDGPTTASALARETGASLLAVNSAHTVSRADFEKGVTFASIMEKNLEQLKTAMECRN